MGLAGGVGKVPRLGLEVRCSIQHHNIIQVAQGTNNPLLPVYNLLKYSPYASEISLRCPNSVR